MFRLGTSALASLILMAGLSAAAVCVRLDVRRRRMRRGQYSFLLLLDLAGPAMMFFFAVASFAAIWALGLLQHVTVIGGTTEAWLLASAGACAAAAFFLWNMGSRSDLETRAPGRIFAAALISWGVTRMPIEVLHRRSALLPGLFVIVGVAMLFLVTRAFRRQPGEHRILQQVAAQGHVLQPEYHRETEECPEPERWRMYDSMTAEYEVLAFLQQLVETVKPKIVVETGTFMGISTMRLAAGLRANGTGKVITCEHDPVVYAKAVERIALSGLEDLIDARNESSLDMRLDGADLPIDLLFSDSDPTMREAEVRRFLPSMRANALIVIHDASSHLRTVRDAALRLEQEGLVSVVLLPTPRGLVMAQKREGRTQ